MTNTRSITQAVNALAAARDALTHGHSDQEVLKRAKQAAGFSGNLRGPLAEMLDAVGLQRRLGLASTAALFAEKADWLQTASAIAFPTFVDEKNYNGTPDMTRRPVLMQFLTSHLAPLIKTLAHAIIIPLGPKPTQALN